MITSKEALAITEKKQDEIHELEKKLEDAKKEYEKSYNNYLFTKNYEDLLSNKIMAKKLEKDGTFDKYLDMSKVFTYCGCRFIDLLGRVLTKSEAKTAQCHMRNAMCILTDADGYTWEDFYNHIYGKRKRDLYLCLDDGKVYMPCGYGVMWVDNETLKEFDWYEDLSPILAANNFLKESKAYSSQAIVRELIRGKHSLYGFETSIVSGDEYPVLTLIAEPLTVEAIQKHIKRANQPEVKGYKLYAKCEYTVTEINLSEINVSEICNNDLLIKYSEETPTSKQDKKELNNWLNKIERRTFYSKKLEHGTEIFFV